MQRYNVTDAGTRSGTAAWRWWRGPAWTGSPGWWSTWTCARWVDTDYLHIYYLHIYYLRIYYLLSTQVLCNYGYNPWQTVAIPEVETVVVRTGFNWGLFARV